MFRDIFWAPLSIFFLISFAEQSANFYLICYKIQRNSRYLWKDNLLTKAKHCIHCIRDLFSHVRFPSRFPIFWRLVVESWSKLVYCLIFRAVFFSSYYTESRYNASVTLPYLTCPHCLDENFNDFSSASIYYQPRYNAQNCIFIYYMAIYRS